MQGTAVYKPVAANATGYAAGVTGASWPLTSTVPGDGLAHQVTITNNTANSHAAKTVLIVGTDALGAPQSETINLPAASVAVTSTKYYATVTRVTPSATIGADTMGIGWNASLELPCYPLNHRQKDFKVGFAVLVSGTASVAVQYTYSDLRDPANVVWFNHATLPAVTANSDGAFSNPLTAMRLKFNSYTAPVTVSLAVVQNG